ncbi:MAG: methyltransferase domain-containing protein [Pseudomonadota bacterium]
MTNIQLFDHEQFVASRERAAQKEENYRFLFDWSLKQILDSLNLVKKEFQKAVQIDVRSNESIPIEQYGIQELIKTDFIEKEDVEALITQEILPFEENSIDLVVSNLNLHRINDLPGMLIQINRSLKEDGLFIGSLFGGETLHELRDVLQETELEIYGGISPRIFPFADIRDVGSLLQRAKYNLPVIDAERVRVTYDSLEKLVHDIRYMGEGNNLVNRNKKPVGKKFWQRAEEIYFENHSEDGKIVATFDIIFMLGWKESATQQKPMRPGSAKNRLADALQTEETALHD